MNDELAAGIVVLTCIAIGVYAAATDQSLFSVVDGVLPL